ncbi:major facilitator superfamily domain-containing protein [Rhodotorula diobovata]|uniref:Major facilitator superfamily domain-containing protein n=1 Tax=Rhodotorula diobovata TaxID=5288 RepID=A0A5C5FSM3_9BASI|nr:major facilitator superfamily domain-containing protein [Rhodotorula diobovata]
MSSTTVVGAAAPPLTGYQGGGLARQFTSNDFAPVEAIVARRRGQDDLRERDEDDEERTGSGGLEAGLTAQRVDARGEKAPPGQEGGRREDAVFAEGKGEVAVEEWTFPDGGLKAWTVIFGCFLYSCNVQGYGMVWGALIQDLQKHHPDADLSVLNLIVGLQNFGLNAAPFVTGRLGELYGFKRMIAIGSTLSVILLVCSAVAVDSLPALFVLQGILLGIAHGISLPLFMTIPSQWFSRRRGFATGITVSGTGWGGGIASLIMRAMLPSLGYRNTLLVYAGISAVVYAFAWSLLKVRKPPARATPARWETKTGLPPGIFRDPAFYSLVASVTVGVWGFLTPSYYLTDFTASVDPANAGNSLHTAAPLIVQNFAIGVGRICAGSISDFVGPCNAMFFSFAAGGILQLGMWSQIDSYGSTVAFGVLYGLFGSWFFLLMPAVAANLFGLRGLATITGWVVASQAPGQLAGASVSGVVLSSSGRYSCVAYYAGACMLGGAAFILPGAPLLAAANASIGADAPEARAHLSLSLTLRFPFTARFLRQPMVLARY